MPLIEIEEDELFHDFLCPIRRTLIKDPAVASDGHAYEREAIEEWFKNHSTSPKTGVVLVDKSLKAPPHIFKSSFESLLKAKNICTVPPFLAAVREGRLDQLVTTLNYYSRHLEARDEKDESRTALHIAAYRGHEGVVALLLADGAEIKALDKQGCTPLHLACGQGHNESVQILVKAKADLESKDSQGNRPVHYAVKAGQAKTIALLQEFKADFEAENDQGERSLHLAVQHGHIAVVWQLLTAGLKHDSRTLAGKTALHIVAERGHLESISALLAAGADPTLTDSQHDRTPLALALTNNHPAIVKCLLEAQPDLVTGAMVKEGLLEACRKGQIELVKVLLETKANVPSLKAAIDHGQVEVVRALLAAKATMEPFNIHDALRLGNVDKPSEEEEHLSAEMVSSLIEFKANLSTKEGYQQQTVLHTAASNSRARATQVLLDAKVDVNVPDANACTALHVAGPLSRFSFNAFKTHNFDLSASIIQTLLTAKADIEAKNYMQQTPLFTAESAEGAKSLIGSKANIAAVDKDGNTPLHINQNSGVARVLLDAKADPNGRNNMQQTPLHMSQGWGRIQTLVEAKAQVMAPDVQGNTALHVASQYQPSAFSFGSSIVDDLLAVSADPNARNHEQKTPLHLAASVAINTTVKALITAKADVDAPDQAGKTALHYAAEKGHKTTVEILLAAKANRLAKDKAENTPLAVATQSNKPEVVEALLKSPYPLSELHLPLAHACEYGHVAVLKLLLNAGAGTKINTEVIYGDDNQSPLYRACAKGQIAVLHALHEAKCDLGLTQSYYYRTPLQAAAQNNHAETVSILLTLLAGRRATLDADHRNKRTTLEEELATEHKQTLAAAEKELEDERDREKRRYSYHGYYERQSNESRITRNYTTKVATERERLETEHKKQVETKRDALEKDYKAESENESEAIYTALAAAAEKGHVEVVSAFLTFNKKRMDARQYEAYLNSAPTQEALCLAVGNGHRNVVDLFNKEGADLTCKDDRNNTLLYLAADGGHVAVVEALLEVKRLDQEAKNSRGETALLQACFSGHEPVARLLVQAKANVNAVDNKERSVLHWTSNAAIIKLLVEAKADTRVVNKEHQTPLLIATRPETIRALVDAKADLAARDEQGNTALHFAINEYKNDKLETLLEIKADPELENNDAQTALHLAAKQGNSETVTALLTAGANHEAMDKNCETPLHLARKNNKHPVAQLLQTHQKQLMQAARRVPQLEQRIQQLEAEVQHLQRQPASAASASNLGTIGTAGDTKQTAGSTVTLMRQ